jgi:hypothetical protein
MWVQMTEGQQMSDDTRWKIYAVMGVGGVTIALWLLD